MKTPLDYFFYKLVSLFILCGGNSLKDLQSCEIEFSKGLFITVNRHLVNMITACKTWRIGRSQISIACFFFNCHCVKSAQTRSYFWSVFSCIQSEYRKIRTRNNSIFGHFSHSVPLLFIS